MSTPSGGGYHITVRAADDREMPTPTAGTRTIPGPRRRRAHRFVPAATPAAAAAATVSPAAPAAAGAGAGHPLRSVAFSAVTATVVLTLAGCGVLILHLVRRQTGTTGLLVGLGLAMVPLPFVLGGLAWLNQTARVPLRHTVFCLGWGACAATTVAILANGWTSTYLSAHQGGLGEALGADLVTPVIEEGAKGAALLVLLLPLGRRARCATRPGGGTGPGVPNRLPGPRRPRGYQRRLALPHARARLRLRPYRRLWTTQLIGGTADRLGLLVLLALTVIAAVLGGQFGDPPRSLPLAVAAVLATRLAATGLVGAALLGPVHGLLSGKLDRRWTLFGADALRAVLIGVAPWWTVWLGSGTKPSGAATWILLATVFLTGAAERVWAIAKAAAVPGLLPPADAYAPAAERRPSAANLATVRTLDHRTGWATVPLAAAVLIALTLLNNVCAALGSDWLRAHQATFAALGAAALFAVSAARVHLQELPGGRVLVPPVSPLRGLRAPADATPGPALAKGRTGSAPYFTFAVCAGYAAMAGVAALALLTAAEHGAGPIGYGLLVLAATGVPALGVRITRAVLPSLSRRRLLALALLTEGVALILAGLVPDFVLVLLLTSLAALAAGVVISTGRTLLAQEVEEVRLPQVTEHLYAVLRAVVGAALVGVPLIAAAYGDVEYGTVEPGSFTFIHGGAALAVATAGLLTLVLAAVVLLRTDDRRGTVPFGRDLADAVRGATGPAPHRAGTGFFIALEGGDGAGKSTQAQALAEWIRGKGHEVVLTREPGGSPVGQRLRGLVLDVGNTGLSHRAEALIYAADRAEHVENVIRPALARGAVVITDRYMDSSIAYQGAGRDLAATEVARISRWATGGLLPDLTVVLDVDPTRARERFTEALDRLESEPTEFHQRVRSGFLALAAADPARYLVVDGSQAPGVVTTSIRHRLDRELPLSEQEKAARAEQERKAAEEARRRAEEEARKRAEEEAAERKRQEVLAQLRAEQAEKERLAKEEAEQSGAE
ncbi:dTMP kinase, partial [Kitasatospora putterlickiae]|uniref:dTMP kinase n=1 Tax=Kitasatospora putterlickiae TaxID=221725 RepID=UPI0031D91729